MSSEDALRVYRSSLTAYERAEIAQYPEVWFVGEGAKKIHGMDGMPANCGFDDTNSRYLAKKRDHVAYRYEVLSGLGKGAFGDVYKALDHRTGDLIALKVIRNEKRFHRQGKVEVKVLDMLRKQDADYASCCVHMIDYFIFRNHVRFARHTSPSFWACYPPLSIGFAWRVCAASGGYGSRAERRGRGGRSH